MIIDHKKVITGSFNFTRGADHKNAENVVLIEDPKIANQYLQNWITRKSRSHPL
jgi:phospholipase D